MGVFTRFRDIVSSNLNAILDKAEDPEKMVRLMILEMEDTLIEIRGACAGVIADQKKAERELRETEAAVADWEAKARLAVGKGREELARTALVEKRAHNERAEALRREVDRLREAVKSFQEDLAQLEAKLADAREKQRSIIARGAAAQARRQAQTAIRKVDTSEAFVKFEMYENSIDRMTAEAELINKHRPKSVRDEFAALENEDQIEAELNRIKSEMGRGN